MSEERYEAFVKELEEKMPDMFNRPYGGIAVGEGWWPIVRLLCNQIHAHTEWRNNARKARLEDNPYNLQIPEYVEPVVVSQIKEKFGGLRFYYDGGDDYIDGLVRMAEVWASRSCEECGSPGRSRSGGWIRTLCDHHEDERQRRMKESLDG